MIENKISVLINKSISEVFEFTINPKNTHKWIDSIEKEETNEWPVKVGSIYRNVDTTGKWTHYILTSLNQNSIFELASKDNGYHVRYTYTPVGENSCNLEYFEWMDFGELTSPFSQNVLEKLKEVMESGN